MSKPIDMIFIVISAWNNQSKDDESVTSCLKRILTETKPKFNPIWNHHKLNLDW